MLYRSILVMLAGLSQAATVDSLADGIIGHLMSVYTLIGSASYIAGFCFFCVTIFKFKQHKDNPQQHTIGNALTYLVLSVLLMYMGSIVQPIGDTLFGDGNVIGGYF